LRQFSSSRLVADWQESLPDGAASVIAGDEHPEVRTGATVLGGMVAVGLVLPKAGSMRKR